MKNNKYINKIDELISKQEICLPALEAVDIAQARWLVKNCGYRVIIYGAGKYGKIIYRYAKNVLGFSFDSCVDMFSDEKELFDIPIKRPENVEMKNTVAFIATKQIYNVREKERIKEIYCRIGVKLEMDLMPVIDMLIKEPFYTYTIDHKDEFVDAWNIWEDKESRKTYYNYIKGLLSGQGYQGNVLLESEKYFSLGNMELLDSAKCDYVWINCGSARGDTIFHFLNRFLDYKKIYAIEGEHEIADKLRNNLLFLPSVQRKKIEIIEKYVGMNGDKGCISIDEVVKSEQVDLINMDIEGNEEEAIISASEVIKRCHPILAICAYHKCDDLIKLPKVIKSICGEYRFYLRKYPSDPGFYFNGVQKMNELVLYAVIE